jgi:hypothetical protein
MVMAGTGEALPGPVTCGCVAGATCPMTGDPELPPGIVEASSVMDGLATEGERPQESSLG